MSKPLSPTDLTLGILAGGRASRLGGMDKAWIERGGVPQVIRWQRRFAVEVSAVLVSANRDLARYAEAGLQALPDRGQADLGPIAGLDVLASQCRTPWLLSLPVDLVDTNDCLLRTLISDAADNGAVAEDDDGLQPLVALWRVDALRDALASALASGQTAIHQLQTRLCMSRVRFPGVRFGNLNTPDDLAAAGVIAKPPHHD